MEGILRTVLKHYTFCSLGELNAILSAYHLAVEEVKTEFRGERYEGMIYVPTDDKGNKISTTPIKASDIGRGVGYTAVQNKMQRTKRLISSLTPSIRSKVLLVMRASPATQQELQQRLEEVNLRAVLRTNGNGRIYGITFIDDTEGIALNGSRLGKGYAANVFQTDFSNPVHNPFLNEELYGCPSLEARVSEVHPSLSLPVEEGDNLVDELIEDFIGNAPSSSSGEEWKEAAWQRKLRRQNKIQLQCRKR